MIILGLSNVAQPILRLSNVAQLVLGLFNVAQPVLGLSNVSSSNIVNDSHSYLDLHSHSKR